MTQYSIMGISGAVDNFIVDTFMKLGFITEYNNIGRPLDDSQTAVIISYGHGGFAWVMTSHALRTVFTFTPELFDSWKKNWVGDGQILCREDITHERWANHVLKSYNHIGFYAPLNGLYVEVEKRIGNDKCPRHEIKLEDIVTDPEKVLTQISMIVNKDIPINVREFFLTEQKKKKEIMAPWMNAIVLENKNSRNLKVNHFDYTTDLLID